MLTLVAVVVLAYLSLPDALGTPPTAVPDNPAVPSSDTGAAPPSKVVLVEGQVINHIGAGEAGVAVTVRHKRDGGPGELIAATETDELGDFSLTVDKAVRGPVIVTFSKAQFVDIVREVRLDETEFPPYLAETLEGKLAVRGRVTDASSDQPVRNALVTLRSLYRDWNATTDAQGRFSIERVSPGPGMVIVEADGYGREQQQIEAIGAAEEISVTLKPERVVRLRVVDGRGKLIAGVIVEALDAKRDDFRTTATDTQGAAVLKGVHYDATALQIRLTHDDYVSSEGFDRELSLPAKQRESTHEFTMVQAGEVAGTITDRKTGDPLHGARIMTGTDYSDQSPRDWSDFRGWYLIKGVEPGLVTLTVHIAGRAPELQTVEVAAGKTASVDFQLDSGATISGVVMVEGGDPVAGATVQATTWRGRGTLGLRAMTDRAGRFTIADAPLDEFDVAVFHGRGRPVTKTLKALSGEPVEIKLPQGSATGPEDLVAAKVGDPAPVVTVTALDGASFALADLEGKTVLVDFWATWCSPCVAELPELKTVHAELGPRKDFLMIGVSLDWDEKSVRRFVEKHELAWPQVVGETGQAQKAAEAFGVMGLPAAFLIGPDGKIAAAGGSGAQIGRRAKELLKAPGAP